jgi:hypothetical protein
MSPRLALAVLLLGAAPDEVRTERFDRDPGWDGRNHRSTAHAPRPVKQDFGWSDARRIGGWVCPDAAPAFYAKALPRATFDDALSASGVLEVGPGGNTLVGFFNSETLNEWRTPNSIALRVNGRGEEGFHLHLEYATARWRAGGDFFAETDPRTKKRSARLIPGGKTSHRWTLSYDPRGDGAITATLGDEKLVLPLDRGHKADGASFDRFGILNVMKSADSGEALWLSELAIQGRPEPLDRDPGWEGRGNRRTYESLNVRPRFDFGYSTTRHAGGAAVGELGGLVFRGDERYPDRMAYYGDRLETLTLEKPLRASGRVALARGVTDSTVLIGFFHSTGSMRESRAQVSGVPENFLGIAIEGPSSEGFLFYPLYGTDREGEKAHSYEGAPQILPDSKSHEWTLAYSPKGKGRITVTLDGKAASLELSAAHRALGASFDRFGIVTTHIDGNGQQVWFDDLTYTCRQ